MFGYLMQTDRFKILLGVAIDRMTPLVVLEVFYHDLVSTFGERSCLECVFLMSG
jgi:hypothetical protein